MFGGKINVARMKVKQIIEGASLIRPPVFLRIRWKCASSPYIINYGLLGEKIYHHHCPRHKVSSIRCN